MLGVNLEQYRQSIEHFNPLLLMGSVARVTGLTVESQGPAVGIGRVCLIHLANGKKIPAEVIGFQDNRRILMPLEGVEGISPRDKVTACDQAGSVAVGDNLLGRVIDALGKSIDGKDQPICSHRRNIICPPPAPMDRPKITEPLSFGVRAIDGLLTCGKGQRIGIFAGAGVGKSTLLGEIARSSSADVNVLALIGERGREVRGFIEDSLGPAGLARSVVVVATSDASPIQRVRAAFLAVTVAEHFRDRGKDVLFMMDSVTRLAQAQREIGLAAGEPPTTKGYCPSVFSMLPKLTERMGCAKAGSITGILTTLVEGDDMDDPVADSVRSLLDGHVVLSRKLAEMGHYPAVDILQSISRLMTDITPSDHLRAARAVRSAYATYRDAEDLINIGAYSLGSNPKIDKSINMIDSINTFLRQGLQDSTSYDESIAMLQKIALGWDALPTGATQAA